MAKTSKPDLMSLVITGFLAASDKIVNNIEKGLNDLMVPQTGATKAPPTFEKDMEDIVDSAMGDDSESSAEKKECFAVEIVSPYMSEALTEVGREVSELEEAGYSVTSITTTWQAPEPGSSFANDGYGWVVVSYITYD